MVNTFYALSPDSPMRKAVDSDLRKFRGQRASEPPTNPDGTPGNSHSVSEGSYGSLVKIFNDPINDVSQDPSGLFRACYFLSRKPMEHG
jgi:hypothetical protein